MYLPAPIRLPLTAALYQNNESVEAAGVAVRLAEPLLQSIEDAVTGSAVGGITVTLTIFVSLV